ncbi:MAG: nickel-dependent lactate racemase [Oscillospiraceae bacterium]
MKLELQLPYGKGALPLELDNSRLKAILTSGIERRTPVADENDVVLKAMQEPIGCEPLHILSRGKQHITIIASDHTRPVPSRILMPLILQQIRRGNPAAEITILIATGCHRQTSHEELIEKFGPDIAAQEHIVVHDCDDMQNMRYLGTLPSGGECWVNKWACEADLLLAEGFIEPHFFAGYSGGRKSVLPGVASRSTVLANHCAGFIANPNARAGILADNPIHKDMLWAAEKAGLRYIVNVILDGNKRIIHAVAGDPRQAHAAGCQFLNRLCSVQPAPAEIVITTNGGYPLDQNIYQAVKGLTAAEATVTSGGVIIMLAQSGDGHGGKHFCAELTGSADLDVLADAIAGRAQNQTRPDQWQAQILIRILRRARVIYLSDAPDSLVRSLHMIPAHSLSEAMAIAETLLGKKDASVTVIPDGVSVIVRN